MARPYAFRLDDRRDEAADHYKRHGKRLRLGSVAAYVARAIAIIETMGTDGVAACPGDDGDMTLYVRSSGELVVFNQDTGRIRTLHYHPYARAVEDFRDEGCDL